MGFRDLERYERNKARFEKYKAWLALTPDQRQVKFAGITDESKRAKPERVAGFISPFNVVGNDRLFVNAKILKTDQTGAGSDVATALRTILGNYVEATVPVDAKSLAVKEFKYARLSFTSLVPGAQTKYSRITGAGYKKPEVDTVSSPFGQKTGGQDFDAAVAEIKAIPAFATFKNGNGGKNRYKFTPEGI